MPLSLFPPIFATFVGYNLLHPYGLIMFAIEAIIFCLFLHFSAKFILLDRRYHVFRKDWFVPVFCLGFFLLSLIFCILPIFTTEFVAAPDNSWIKITIFPYYFLGIYFPLFIAYVLFCDCAYATYFLKKYNEKAEINVAYIMKRNNEEKQNEIIKKELNDCK